MPRKPLIRTDLYYYHITTRSNHKEWFSLPLSMVWQISTNSFLKALKENPVNIAQYVLMGNHYHLLVQTPNSDIDKFMYFFNKTFSMNLRKLSGQINRMFGSNYKWSVIYERNYLQTVYRYIYQNPLRAGLVKECYNYPFSTLYYHHRNLQPGFPVQRKIYYDVNEPSINTMLDSEDLNAIRTGLKKTIFKPNSKRRY
ncbi:MAG: transposase [Halobacteriovoraceae bacterium]|nr:transposase [Halobacteriovoraceae bacterium]